MLLLDDTIVALASPSGPAERGIVRVSGEAVARLIAEVFEPDDVDCGWPESRRATRYEGSVRMPAFNTPVPTALMFWPTSRSYTGQPMAELHTVGAPPLLDGLIERLLECGARHANRGEFTMRAFLAGRIDLVQAEAVLGVIDAADHEELHQALNQLGGGITEALASVRTEILTLLGDLEAGLDFVDEDIEFISADEICRRLSRCQSILDALSDDAAERLPSGYRTRVVLAGLPNAGKSTLFNRLVGSQAAIVSPVAGTTRDYLNAIVEFGRLEAELVDTAGWEEAVGLITEKAQQLRAGQVRAGDLIVWCRSALLDISDVDLDERLRQQLITAELPVLHIRTQCDRIKPGDAGAVSLENWLSVSAETGEGLELLRSAVEDRIAKSRQSRSELVSSTAARCRDGIRRAIAAIAAAGSAAEMQAGDEIVAMELRTALQEIAVILGEVYTDDILDHIFSNFCIGK